MTFNILLITNIPTPYRQSFFNSLSRQLSDVSGTLNVCYMASSEPNRNWKVNCQSKNFEQFFVGSRLRYFFGSETYLSIIPFYRWFWLSPEVTILAGAWHYPANIMIVIAAKLMRKKVWFWCESNRYTDNSKNFFLVKTRNIFYRITERFLVPGKSSYDYIRNLNQNSKILFLPNTVEDVFFDKKIVELTPNFAINKFNFVTVCELVDRKGVMELIEDFDFLVEAGKIPETAVLNICGSGVLESQVKKFAVGRPWIKYHGFKSSNELIKIMMCCCGFILNTKLDPNPLVVNEACCLGLIPILSRRAGNAYEISRISTNFDFTYEFGELKKSLEAYLLTKPHDLESYSCKIKRFASELQPDMVAKDLINSIKMDGE